MSGCTHKKHAQKNTPNSPETETQSDTFCVLVLPCSPPTTTPMNLKGESTSSSFFFFFRLFITFVKTRPHLLQVFRRTLQRCFAVKLLEYFVDYKLHLTLHQQEREYMTEG